MQSTAYSKLPGFWTWIVVAVALSMFAGCGGGGGGTVADNSSPPITPGGSGGTVGDNSSPPITQGGMVPLKTAAGTPNGVSATKIIGPAGGTLSSTDGRVQLTVPAGAVAADTQLTITPLTNPANNALATYRLEPEGTTFVAPVTLTFSAPEAGVSFTSVEGLGIAYQQADGSWQWQAVNGNSDAKTLSVTSTHFSVYSLMAGAMLAPVSADVDVNKHVKLQTLFCAEPSTFSPASAAQIKRVAVVFRVDSAFPVYECVPLSSTGIYRMLDWSVNSISGGNATVGTFAESTEFEADYWAPTEQPNPKTVKVSSQLQVIGTKGLNPATVLLVSQITVGKQADYFGTFTATIRESSGEQWTASGDATWTATSKDSYYGTLYDVKIRVAPDQTTFKDGNNACVLTSPKVQSWTDPGSATLNLDTVPPRFHWQIAAFWAHWDASCTDPDGRAYTVPNLLVISWATECVNPDYSMTSAQLDSSQLPDVLHGTFSSGSGICNNERYDATVTWDFFKGNPGY